MTAAATRHTWTRSRGDRGVAAIEFIIVFPMLLLLFIGTINITQFMNVTLKVKTAADLAADLVTRHKDTIQNSDIDDYFTAAELSLRPIDAKNVRVDIYNYYRKNKTDTQATLRWSKSSSNGTACTNPDTSITSPISKLVVAGQTTDVVLAVVCVPFSMPGIPLLGTAFKNTVIEKQMFMAIRESQTLCISTPCP